VGAGLDAIEDAGDVVDAVTVTVLASRMPSISPPASAQSSPRELTGSSFEVGVRRRP